MQHIRLTVRHDPNDSSDDLRQIAQLRRDLLAHSPVEIDPDNPFCETQRDAEKNAYFEFVTESTEQVRHLLRERGHEDRVTLEVVQAEVGLVCAKCGFFAGFVTVCPNCGHRDIAPCPSCGKEIAREHYLIAGPDTFICPNCRRRVQMQLNPGFYKADGTNNQPVVLVQNAP